MDIAILVLLIVSLLFNIILAILVALVIIVLVRARESNDQEHGHLKGSIKRLTSELLIRLPPRPYGVDETPPSLTVGPNDSRIPR